MKSEDSRNVEAVPASSPTESNGESKVDALKEGTILHGEYEYRIMTQLGHGGFGITYLAEATVKVKKIPQTLKFCIKEFYLSGMCSRESSGRVDFHADAETERNGKSDFKAEAKILMDLNDVPGIVPVSEIIEANNTVYYVMQFLEGQTLDKMIDANKCLKESDALPIIEKVGKALCVLHDKKMTHLDIKPENIMLVGEGSSLQPVLIDFGLCRIYNMFGRETSGKKVFAISEGYSPVEQYGIINEFTPEADVYALAATLFHALTGEVPVPAGEITDSYLRQKLQKRGVSRGTMNSIVCAMQKEKDYRTGTVNRFLADLEMDLSASGLGHKTRMISNPAPAPNPRPSRRIYYILAVIVALVAMFFSLSKVLRLTNPSDTKAMINMGEDYYYGRNGKTKDYVEAVRWYRNAAEQGDAEGQWRLGYMYEKGLGVGQDYAEAVKWYRNAAEQGDAEGQRMLGKMYCFGLGVSQDYAEAVKWDSRSAEQGNARGQSQLGYMYCNGFGVTQDYSEALDLFRKAAEQGDATAQSNLGAMYHNGLGVGQDYAEAIKWYLKSVEQGNAGGQNNLGVIYENGHGVSQDYAEAVKWYSKAADQGVAEGQWRLGYMYEKGHGVSQDYAEAVKWYLKSAEQGDAEGQRSLGYMYEKGHGVSQDYAEAVKWYRKSAEQGNADGQFYLGTMYQYGQGVSQDYTEAVKWYRKAAEQGNAGGQTNLGNMYYNGQGVGQDYAEAVKWYCKAAEQGDATAQYNLGLMYYYGTGVKKDLKEAKQWFQKAAAQGYEDAKKILKEFK